MTPDELEAARQERDRERAAALREGRSKQLVHDVGAHRSRKRKSFAEQCAKNWPRLSEEERDATVDRAMQLVIEYAEKREANRTPDLNDGSDVSESAETEIVFTGRRLEGAEFEEAARMVAKKNAGEFGPAEARAFAIARLRENPKLKCTDLLREAQAKGYAPSYSTFYKTVYRRAQHVIVPASAEDPPKEVANGCGDGTRAGAGRRPAAGRVAEAVAARGGLRRSTGRGEGPGRGRRHRGEPVERSHPQLDGARAPGEKGDRPGRKDGARHPGPHTNGNGKKPDPTVGTGGFLIQALKAVRKNGKTSIRAIIDVEGDVGDCLSEFTARLRGAA